MRLRGGLGGVLLLAIGCNPSIVLPLSPGDAGSADGGVVDAGEADRPTAPDVATVDAPAPTDVPAVTDLGSTVDVAVSPDVPPVVDAVTVVDVPPVVDAPAADVPAADAGCSGPAFAVCGGACVSLTTSRDHCGACGRRCGAGDCEAGVCQPCAPGMRLIPAGEFVMGSSANASEGPAHRVRLSAFCLEEVEVTVADYRACVTAGACTTPTTVLSPNWDVAGRDEHPMNNVNWSQARAYCQWRGRDLPTEAQWEYAARGSDGRTYAWGNEVPAAQSCWNRIASPGSSCPVRSYAATQFGLYDMAGNVWEWTRDWYGPYTSTAGATPVDPTGPATGTNRVFRGGSWYIAVPDIMRAAVRYQNAPAFSVGDVGIRCAGAASAP